TALRDSLLLRIIQGVRDEPRVERRGVEIAERGGGEIRPGSEIAQCQRPSNVAAGCRVPRRRRVACPGSGDRDERKQHRLADLDDPGVPVAGLTVFFLSPLMRLLAVFMQLLAGLDRVQSLGHQRTPAPPGKPYRRWRLELR